MLSFSHQRVAVFIDTANLYHTAKHVFGGRVQFQSLLETAERGRALVRALAYTVSTEGGEERNFTDSLRSLGIEIRSKELITYKNGDKKADWDVGIAVDAISIAPHVDVVVLASGDGDFVPLVKHLREQGVRVEVMAFDQSISQSLIDVVDEYINMSDSPEQYVFAVRQYGRNSDARLKTRDNRPVHAGSVNDVMRRIPISHQTSTNGGSAPDTSHTMNQPNNTRPPIAGAQMKHGMTYITPDTVTSADTTPTVPLATTGHSAAKSAKVINSTPSSSATPSAPAALERRSTAGRGTANTRATAASKTSSSRNANKSSKNAPRKSK